MMICQWSSPKDLQGTTPAGIVAELRNVHVVYNTCYGNAAIVDTGDGSQHFSMTLA
jgi:hypothetical protein